MNDDLGPPEPDAKGVASELIHASGGEHIDRLIDVQKECLGFSLLGVLLIWERMIWLSAG